MFPESFCLHKLYKLNNHLMELTGWVRAEKGAVGFIV